MNPKLIFFLTRPDLSDLTEKLIKHISNQSDHTVKHTQFILARNWGSTPGQCSYLG